MRKVTVPFSPPLASSDDARARLKDEHNRVLTPDLMWLITEPIILIFTTSVILLGYATLFIGKERLVGLIEETPVFNRIIPSIFGSATLFANLVRFSFYFAVVAHGLEAVYVAYECITKLRIRARSTMLWFFLVCCTGFPVAFKITPLVDVYKKSKQKKGAGMKND